MSAKGNTGTTGEARTKDGAAGLQTTVKPARITAEHDESIIGDYTLDKTFDVTDLGFTVQRKDAEPVEYVVTKATFSYAYLWESNQWLWTGARLATRRILKDGALGAERDTIQPRDYGTPSEKHACLWMNRTAKAHLPEHKLLIVRK